MWFLHSFFSVLLVNSTAGDLTCVNLHSQAFSIVTMEYYRVIVALCLVVLARGDDSRPTNLLRQKIEEVSGSGKGSVRHWASKISQF
jgi:hypothetical protein